MYQCILKFCVISVCLISKLFIIVYITGQASAQDWSMLLRKPYDQERIEERAHLQDKDASDHDEDADNPCPIAKNGESAPQPWDINSVHGMGKPWLNFPLPDLTNNNDQEQEQEQESSDSNCKDNASDVVIKILFNRDEPCDKKKTVVRFDQNSKYQVISKPGVNVNISNTPSNMWKK